MRVVVSKAFKKWLKENKSNKVLIETIDKFLLRLFQADSIANVAPQPKAAGKNLRKTIGTVDEFTLNKSYRIYSKCVELEPGIVSFCLATAGIKGNTNQNDDILSALEIFDNVSAEKWTEWKPSAAQLQALATAELLNSSAAAPLDDAPAKKEKKSKGKRLDENGMTVAERKMLRRQQEAQKRKEADKQKKAARAAEAAQKQAAEDALAAKAEQILAHKPAQPDENLSKDQQNARKAVNTAVTLLSEAEDLDKTAKGILASSANSTAKAKAKEISHAVQLVHEAYARTINAAAAVAKTSDTGAQHRAAMVATVAMRSLQRNICAARKAYAALQDIMGEKQSAVTTPAASEPVQASAPAAEQIEVPTSTPVAESDGEVAPENTATEMHDADDDIADDEIRVLGRPSVTVNDIPQPEPQMPIGDIKFEDNTDIQYELAVIEHNMNIQRSRIAIAEQMISIEQAKIEMEHLEIEKLKLQLIQKVQQLQK